MKVNDKEVAHLASCLSELAALHDKHDAIRGEDFQSSYENFRRTNDPLINDLIKHDEAEQLREIAENQDYLRTVIAIVKERNGHSTEPLSPKWFENGKQVIALYLKDHPEAILSGFRRANLLDYYTKLNLRTRLDAGPGDRAVQQGTRELVAAGFLEKRGNDDTLFFVSVAGLREVGLS